MSSRMSYLVSLVLGEQKDFEGTQLTSLDLMLKLARQTFLILLYFS
jgi:hypothetical protein